MVDQIAVQVVFLMVEMVLLVVVVVIMELGELEIEETELINQHQLQSHHKEIMVELHLDLMLQIMDQAAAAVLEVLEALDPVQLLVQEVQELHQLLVVLQ